jgi:hypothetical protein
MQLDNGDSGVGLELIGHSAIAPESAISLQFKLTSVTKVMVMSAWASTTAPLAPNFSIEKSIM